MLRVLIACLMLPMGLAWAVPPTTSPRGARVSKQADRTAGQPDLDQLKRELAVQKAQLAAQKAQLDKQRAALDKQQSMLQKHDKKLANQGDQIDDVQKQIDEQTLNANDQKSKRRFSLYGFFDINFLNVMRPKVPLDGLVPTAPGFVFGNLNVYFDFQASESWRFLTEVRLLLNPLADVETLENEQTGDEFKRVNVSTYDASAFGLRFNYGAIEIERAQIEWNRYQMFKVTAGLFLTPFGVWNVDHGSPARALIQTPYLYTESSVYDSKFPERQLGLMVHGEFLLADILATYAITLSNGRGPAATQIDFDADKGIGGRFTIQQDGNVKWKVGLSFYTSLYSDFKQKFVLAPEPDIIALGPCRGDGRVDRELAHLR
jgi:hypothetical protein